MSEKRRQVIWRICRLLAVEPRTVVFILKRDREPDVQTHHQTPKNVLNTLFSLAAKLGEIKHPDFPTQIRRWKPKGFSRPPKPRWG